MAFIKIRGAQIQDRIITNDHIADDANIGESKLNIDWDTHYQSALASKKVVDFVQRNGVAVSASSNFVDITAFLTGENAVLSDPLTGEGIIVDSPKNKVPMRDSVTGDPFTIVDGAGVAKEVYGRIVHTPAVGGATPQPEKWEVQFFYLDETDVEQAYSFASSETIDLQYAKRFNLDTVSEMFAANEKFVEGSADATAHLNIQQLAKDIYGADYALNRDGNATLGQAVTDKLDAEITRAQQAETNLQTSIDTEVTNRTTAITGVRNDFASTATGKGASLVGIEDANAKFAATTVEGALGELEGRIASVETATTEVTDARTSTVKSKTFGTLDGRLEELEQDHVDHKADLASTANAKGASLVGIEDVDAYYTAETVEGALKEAFDKTQAVETYVASESSKIHAHKKYVYVAVGGETEVTLPNGQSFQMGDDTLDVYFNGGLQVNVENYTEVADISDASKGVKVNFNGATLIAGDIIALKYINNNAVKTF